MFCSLDAVAAVGAVEAGAAGASAAAAAVPRVAHERSVCKEKINVKITKRSFSMSPITN